MRPSEEVGEAEVRLARALGLGPGAKYPDWLWTLIDAARRGSALHEETQQLYEGWGRDRRSKGLHRRYVTEWEPL